MTYSAWFTLHDLLCTIYSAQFTLQCGVTGDECGSVSPGGLSAAALVSTFTKPNIQCPATGSYGWRWKCGETTPDPPVGNPVTTGVRLYSLLILSTRLFGDKELLARQDGLNRNTKKNAFLTWPELQNVRQPPPPSQQGGSTNERPGSDHVTWGPVRGLNKNYMKRDRYIYR